MNQNEQKEKSIKNLRKICQPPEKLKGLSIRYLRYISIYFTKIFLLLGISANQVTIIGFFILLLAFFLFSFGPPIWIIGTLLMILWYIMDFSDGEVSRYNGTSSLKGAWLDDRIGEVAPVMKWFGITIGIYMMFPSLTVILFGSLAIVFPRLRHALKTHYKLLTKNYRSDIKIKGENNIKIVKIDEKNKKNNLIDFIVNKIGLRTEYILLVTMLLDLMFPPLFIGITKSFMFVNIIIPSYISFTFAFMIVFGIAETISYFILISINFKKLNS